MSLYEALRELSEPFLSGPDPAREDGRALARRLYEKLEAEPPWSPADEPWQRREAAAAVRERLLQQAIALNEILEEAARAEATRLAPLAVALDWLVRAPAEDSLARQLTLIDQAEPASQRVGEVLGTLGAVMLEASALEGEAACARPQKETQQALEALAKVRLMRVASLVDRWLAQRSGEGRA